MVSHLLRQSQFERRLAVELLQTRHEKDVLRQNRIAYERQLEIRRRQDFIEAMDREAVKFIRNESNRIVLILFLRKWLVWRELNMLNK